MEVIQVLGLALEFEPRPEPELALALALEPALARWGRAGAGGRYP